MWLKVSYFQLEKKLAPNITTRDFLANILRPRKKTFVVWLVCHWVLTEFGEIKANVKCFLCKSGKAEVKETKLGSEQRRDPLTDVDVFFSGQRPKIMKQKVLLGFVVVKGLTFPVEYLEIPEIRSAECSTVVTYQWSLWTVTSPTNEHPQFKKHFNFIFFAVHFTSTSFSYTQVQSFEYSTLRTASEHCNRSF